MRRRLLLMPLGLVLAFTLIAPLAAARNEPHCALVSQPLEVFGHDWNAVLDYGGWIVVSVPGANQLPRGACWTPHSAWIVNSEYPADIRQALVAQGYVFKSDRPVDDFLNKLKQVTFVIDPGTPERRTWNFKPESATILRTVGDLFRKSDAQAIFDPDHLLGDELAFPIALFYVYLPTPADGPNGASHHVAVYLTMSDRQNDGMGLSVGDFLLKGNNLG